MESFGHKMFISSQAVPLTGTGVLYPRVRDFFNMALNNLFKDLKIQEQFFLLVNFIIYMIKVNILNEILFLLPFF